MSQDLSKDPRLAAEQIRNMAHATKEASGTFSRLTVESDTFFSKLRKSFTSKFFTTLSYAIRVCDDGAKAGLSERCKNR